MKYLLFVGWRMKKSESFTDVDYSLMSSTGEVFNSMKLALEHMESSEDYTELDTRNVKLMYENENKQNRQQKYDWVDGDDTVPLGWKTRVVDGKMRKKFFLAPDGSSFSCRRSGSYYFAFF